MPGISVLRCVQSEGLSSGHGYEGLNRAYLEPIEITSPSDHYAGLVNQTPGSGLDRHGYIEVIADPEYNDQPQVCMEIYYLYVISSSSSFITQEAAQNK